MRHGWKHTGQLLAVAFVGVVAAAGIALALHGWREDIPSTDMLPALDSARAFLGEVRIPDRGVVSSLGSFVPPGAVWILVPDAALLTDARLFGRVGSAVLHAGTILGVWLLARTYFGAYAALLSVLLYGLSEIGISRASALTGGPRGDPFFSVWAAYFICRWAQYRDARYLAAAITVCMLGIYVFLELAPVLTAVLLVWAYFRPPVRWRPMAAATMLVLVAWSPYIHFEASRSFVDLQSQLLRRDIRPADYMDAWCDSTATLLSWSGESGRWEPAEGRQPLSGFMVGAGRRVLGAATGSIANFEQFGRGMSAVLLTLTIAGIVALPGWRHRAGLALERLADSSRLRIVAGVIALGGAALASERTAQLIAGLDWEAPESTVSALGLLKAMLGVLGVGLLLWKPLARFVGSVRVQVSARHDDCRPLILSLVGPWAVLLLVVEHARPDRILQMWPLQAIVIAGLLVSLTPGLGYARLLWKVGTALFVLALVAPSILDILDQAGRQSWSGKDSDEAKVAAYVAADVRASGRDRAAIGYDVLVEPWVPQFAAIDSRYKTGAELDVLLQFPYGLANTNTCPEGFTKSDEYRIVQDASGDGPDLDLLRFDVPMDRHFRPIAQVGPYRVYRQE